MKYVVTLNGKNYEVVVEKGEAVLERVTDVQDDVAPAPAATTVPTVPPAQSVSGTEVRAPMPGLVVQVARKAGSCVKKDDVILILEAMKMENEIVAPCDGVLSQVAVNNGDQVKNGELLFVVA